MRLADFILANTEPILAEWEVFARSIWPGGAATDPATLRDDAEEMLRATASDMKADQTAAQRSNKSKGKGGDGSHSAGVDLASAAHGVGRVASGFDLATLIAEYRALRASVIRLWRESQPDPDLNDLDDLTRFNESIDQSLTGAILAYTQHVERDRRRALDEQTNLAQELREMNDALLVSSVRQQELMERANDAAAELREAKEQAEAANRAKDHFLAVLSHELRTPLTPVLMAAAAMEFNPDLPTALRDDVKMIRRNVELEGKLIDDLLDLSRIASGKLRLAFDLIGINDLLRQTCETCRAQIHEKGIHLHCDLIEHAGEVVGDPARLQQVFWNLLNNAAKFTPEGGHIYISAKYIGNGAHPGQSRPPEPGGHSEQAGQVRVTVRDTGIGIAPEILPRIFDAFEQGEVRITRQFGGLGLGLAICKALVEQHQGSIRAETAPANGPDRGATFVVELPALSREEAVAAAAAANAPGSRARNVQPLRLMLVEDHVDTARMLGKLLRAAGHTVATASTAAAALALAAAQTFDIVISDLGLPDMTGYELMKRIKEKYGTTGIAMSGYGMEEDIKKGEQAGFSDHLVKPVNFERLEQSIRRVAGIVQA